MKHRILKRAMTWALAATTAFSVFPAASAEAFAEEAVKETSSCTAKGSGSESDPYLLSSLEQLQDLQRTTDAGTSYEGKYFRLTDNIDAASETMESIGENSRTPFSGHFDGGGKYINITIEDDGSGAGLFGSLIGGSVKNLTLKGRVTGKDSTGGLAGIAKDAEIAGCIVESDVITQAGGYNGGVGGIVGVSEGATTLSDVKYTGKVTIDWSGNNSSTGVGGIVGIAYSGTLTIQDTVNQGTIAEAAAGATTTAGMGGLVGYGKSTVNITDSSNQADLSINAGGSTAKLGGLVGDTEASANVIARSYNTGAITNQSTITSACAGGLIGYGHGQDQISESYNTGAVKVVGGYAGGIVGRLNKSGYSILSSYNRGTVTNEGTEAAAYAGGIAGLCNVTAEVKCNYNAGKVVTSSTSAKSGGILGKSYSTTVNTGYISSNYYLKGSADRGISDVAADNEDATKAFTADTLNADMLEDLGENFTADQGAALNDGYPILKWQSPNSVYKAAFRITDHDTGKELSGASVTVENAVPEQDGSYRLPNGTYSYTIEKAGFQSQKGTFKISKSGKTIPAELTSVKHSYRLSVTPADAKVELSCDSLGVLENPKAETDSEKNTAVYTYQLPDKEAYGAISYRISRYTYTPQTGEIALTKDSSAAVVMQKAAVSAFTLSTAPKEAEVKVTLKNQEYGAAAEAEKSDGHTFEYNLVPGTYSYSVKASGYKTQRGTISIPEDSEKSVTLEQKPGWDGKETDTDWYTEHPDAEVYEISEPEELAGLAQLVNVNGADDTENVTFQGKTIRLTKDINLNSYAWTAIGCQPGKSSETLAVFKGTFDGQGHKITGIANDTETKFYDSFFGSTDGAAIKNLDITVDIKTSSVKHGGLISYAKGGTVSHVTVRGKIAQDGTYYQAYIGAIAGESAGLTVEDCVNYADITAGYQLGGMVGNTKTGPSESPVTTITRCVNYGTISGSMSGSTKAYAIGGIAGCLSKADVIRYCINKGEVKGSVQTVGGIAGIAQSKNAAIRSSCNSAPLSSGTDGSYVGGIIGYFGGYSSADVYIQNCLNTAAVSGGEKSSLGGIIGSQYGTTINTGYIKDNYYLESDAFKGSGISTEDTEGAYESFARSDQNEYSELIENLGADYMADQKKEDGTYAYNNGYPALRWQDPDASYVVAFKLVYDTKANQGNDEAAVQVKNAAGEAAAVREDGTYALKNGSYSYSVSRKGYETVKGTLDVNGENLTETVSLKAVKYRLFVKCGKSVNFELYQGTEADKEAVETPAYDADQGGYSYQLYNGTYGYSADQFGYQSDNGKIEISYAGTDKTIQLTAEQTQKVSFTISSQGAGGFSGKDPAVSLYAKGGRFDGQLIGTYDADSSIASGVLFPKGEYTYKVKAKGYDTASGTFTVSDSAVNQTLVLQVKSGWGGSEDTDTDWYKDHPDQKEYTIHNESEFAGLADLVNQGITTFSGVTVFLDADLNLKDNAWTPIGGYGVSGARAFQGTFDGKGHSITFANGTFEHNETSFGIFGYLRGASVKNLVLRGSVHGSLTDQTGKTWMIYVGALAGYTNGSTITGISNQMNLEVTADTTGMGIIDIGGLTGWSLGTSYDRCSNISRVTGTFHTTAANAMVYAGGLVGFSNSSTATTASDMTNCYNTGAVSANGSNIAYAGGLIGNLSGSKSTFAMENCYSTGSVTAAAASTAAHPLVGNGTKGTFNNNYYLDSVGTDETAKSAAKTDAYLKSEDMVSDLGAAYAKNPNGGYPLLEEEQPINHITVTKMPEKTEYRDLEAFDETGMEIAAYTSADDSKGGVIASGWTILNGSSLKADQKTVTVEYKGATAEVPIRVKQVLHTVPAEEMKFTLTAPQAGKTPQTEIELDSAQEEKFHAQVSWTKNGKAVKGAFETGGFYRAEITLSAVYETGLVYYEFDQSYAPSKDKDMAEIKNVSYTKNADGAVTKLTYEICYPAVGLDTALTQQASHLYYEGNPEYGTDLGRYLDRTLTIRGGSQAAEKAITVRELEKEALTGTAGIEAKYGSLGTLDGIRLYDLLTANGLSENTDDTVKITLEGDSGKQQITVTVGELRKDRDNYILAYGSADKKLPFGANKGPICFVNGTDESSCGNVTGITIGTSRDAAHYPVTFTVNEKDPLITVTDAYGNRISSADNPSVYELRDKETYHYTVTKENYTVKHGTVTLDGKAQQIKANLLPVWNGKEIKEPQKDSNGAYLIGSAEELMWWAKNGKRNDSVKLTADIALNDGDHYVNVWNAVSADREDNSFIGSFDGQGHTIYGFYLKRENTIEYEVAWDGSVLEFADHIGQLGMFGYAKDAVIKDLGLEGKITVFDRPASMYANWMQVGGIVGLAQGSTEISGCYTNLGISVIPSDETATVGGYPLAGFADKCDTYIGGIAGSLGAQSKVSDCYSKGSYITAGYRKTEAGGIAGGLRSSGSIQRCYSTALLNVTARKESSMDSAIGGIVGNAQSYAVGGKGNTDKSFAFNGSITGSGSRISAGRITGAGETGGTNYAQQISSNIAFDPSDEAGGKNGKLIDRVKAETPDTYTDAGWSDKTWQLKEGSYPYLSWQSEAPSENQEAENQKNSGENAEPEWDGIFGAAEAPPYFGVYFQVEGHKQTLAKKFSRAEMKQMAAEDNKGLLYYSSKSYGESAGRVSKEYVYLDTLLKNAGVSFASGDTLDYGSKNGLSFSYDDLMAERYYYPGWTAGSSANAQAVRPSIALKSYGASSGVSAELLKYYAAHADYLYAYMLNFGQKTPEENTYGSFVYQQTDTMVCYKAAAAANETVKSYLNSRMEEAQKDADQTAVAEDASAVGRDTSYTGQEARDSLLKAIQTAREVYGAANATNDSVMTACEKLAAEQKAFDAEKKQGAAVSRKALEQGIAAAKEQLASAVRSFDGSDVPQNRLWVTPEDYSMLQAVIQKAEATDKDSHAAQHEIDQALRTLESTQADFGISGGSREWNARQEAQKELQTYADQIDRTKYREQEQKKLDGVCREYLEKIQNAETVNDISNALTDGKKALAAVPTQAQVLEEEKKKAQEELEKQLAAAEAKKASELAAAKNAAYKELKQWSGKTSLYYQSQQITLLRDVLKGTEAVNSAQSVSEVKKAQSSTVKALKKIKTKKQIDRLRKQFQARKTSLKKVKAGKKKVAITWRKTKGAGGYQIQITSKSGSRRTVTVKGASGVKKTVTKLKSRRKYTVRIRAYSKIYGKTVYAKWSSRKSVTVK
jgi:hypothetical protein